MILYGISTCDTCKKALKTLQAAGKDVDLPRHPGHPVDRRPRSTQSCTEFGDRAVNKQSTTYRGFNDFLKASDPEAQIAAQPTVMKRPVIQDGTRWYLGWDSATEAALTLSQAGVKAAADRPPTACRRGPTAVRSRSSGCRSGPSARRAPPPRLDEHVLAAVIGRNEAIALGELNHFTVPVGMPLLLSEPPAATLPRAVPPGLPGPRQRGGQEFCRHWAMMPRIRRKSSCKASRLNRQGSRSAESGPAPF